MHVVLKLGEVYRQQRPTEDVLWVCVFLEVLGWKEAEQALEAGLTWLLLHLPEEDARRQMSHRVN